MIKNLCVVIAPTNSCNLNCTYCYNRYNRVKVEMDYSTVKMIIEKSFCEYDYVDFVWRGGEPLMMDKKFYRRVHFYQLMASRRYGTLFHNSIQTNGTLLSTRWIKTLKTLHFDIGISFDGINNEAHRQKTKQTIEGIARCKKMKCRVGIISVITYENANLIEQYNYFKTLSPHIKLSPCFDIDSSNSSILSPEQYSNQLKQLFDFWINDSDGIAVKPFVDMIQYSLGIYNNRECTHAACLGKMIDVDATGLVRICSHVPDKSFILGNIWDHTKIGDIFAHDNFSQELRLMIEKRDKCKKSCCYYGYCQGGCCAETHLSCSGGKEFVCSITRTLLPHVISTVHGIINSKDNLELYNPTLSSLIKEAICKNPLGMTSLVGKKAEQY